MNRRLRVSNQWYKRHWPSHGVRTRGGSIWGGDERCSRGKFEQWHRYWSQIFG